MTTPLTAAIPTWTPFAPTDTDDGLIDFSAKLAGATIASLVSVVATPTGFGIGTTAIVAGEAGANSGIAFEGIAGTVSAPGTVGPTYTVTANITTSDGRALSRSVYIPVQPR